MLGDQETGAQLDRVIGERPVLHASMVSRGDDSGGIRRIWRNGVGARNAISAESCHRVPDGGLGNAEYVLLEGGREKRGNMLTGSSHRRLATSPSSCINEFSSSLLTDERKDRN